MGTYTLLADRVFDGTGAPAQEDVAVVVDGDRIVAVGPRGAAPGGPVHDLAGCAIVPGLVDPHCHLALAPDVDADVSIAFARDGNDDRIVELMAANARRALAAGVTTVRDLGAPRGTGVAARAIAATDPARYPRVLVSGRPVTTPLGHCHWMGLVARTAPELREAVDELATEGVDLIKVMASGGMMTASSDPYTAQYAVDDLRALVQAAHDRGLKVAAHALSAAGVRAAVTAGVDTLEHYTTTTARPQDFDPDFVDTIAASGTIVGVTAHQPTREMLAAGDHDAIRARLAPHRALYEAGARVTVHSDAGTPGSAIDAFAQSVEIFRIGMGVGVAEAIRAATSTAAAACGMDDLAGQVAVGATADLLIVEGDLEHDATALQHVAAVVRAGHMTTIEEIA